jgi:hypothetical protein
VVAGDLAQKGRGAELGDGPLSVARNGGGVVAEVLEGGVWNVKRGGHDVELCEHGRLFEVAVGDLSARVGEGDDGGLDVGRERVPPVVRGPVGPVEDAAHAGFSSVSGAEGEGALRHDLGQVGGPTTEVGSEAPEAVEAIAH